MTHTERAVRRPGDDEDASSRVRHHTRCRVPTRERRALRCVRRGANAESSRSTAPYPRRSMQPILALDDHPQPRPTSATSGRSLAGSRLRRPWRRSRGRSPRARGSRLSARRAPADPCARDSSSDGPVSPGSSSGAAPAEGRRRPLRPGVWWVGASPQPSAGDSFRLRHSVGVWAYDLSRSAP